MAEFNVEVNFDQLASEIVMVKGEKGDTGNIGATGPANTLAIGTVAKGDNAEATIAGTSPNQTLNLVLPKGDKGDTGATGAGIPSGGTAGQVVAKTADSTAWIDLATVATSGNYSDLNNKPVAQTKTATATSAIASTEINRIVTLGKLTEIDLNFHFSSAFPVGSTTVLFENCPPPVGDIQFIVGNDSSINDRLIIRTDGKIGLWYNSHLTTTSNAYFAHITYIAS